MNFSQLKISTKLALGFASVLALTLLVGALALSQLANLSVKTDEVRQSLEFYKKLIPFLPPDVAAWDDANNNKWLISGKGAMIMNPPSAWAVAKRDAPQVAEQSGAAAVLPLRFTPSPSGFTPSSSGRGQG